MAAQGDTKDSKNSIDRDILNIDQAAEYLGISRAKLYRLINEGKIKGKKIGSRGWRFSKRKLLEWVESGNSANDANVD